jgi:hypothetical protein
LSYHYSKNTLEDNDYSIVWFCLGYIIILNNLK